MPPTKDTKRNYGRSFSNNEMTMSAKVYHPATNLLPPSSPFSSSGVTASNFGSNKSTYPNWSRQNSHNGGPGSNH